MAQSQSIISSLFLSFIFLAALTASFSGSAEAGETVNPKILAACKHTKYADLCISSAKSNHASSVVGVTQSSILATIKGTAQAEARISSLIAQARNKMNKANLNVCKQVYSDAIDNLQKSLKNLKAHSKNDLKINLSAALSDYVTCDDGFTQDPGARSPLAKENSLLNKLSSNNLALADNLH